MLRDRSLIMANKLLVIDLVGLTPEVLSRMPGLSQAFHDRGEASHLVPPLPAVTCSAQATITTGSLPADHGVVSNGWFSRDSGEVRFWMRSDRLVRGEKIWEAAQKRDKNLKVANLFWRFATHSSCDFVVTERPTYWADGRKSPDVFTNPGPLRNKLVEVLGDFPLFRFWGPATSIESSNWIAEATHYVMQKHDPDLTLTYLPHLDYDLQKFGPGSENARLSINEIDEVVVRLIDRARALGRKVAVLSEYGMVEVNRPVFLNRILRRHGFISVQQAQNGELLEAGQSRAFAACSHQIAHLYVREGTDISEVSKLVSAVDGVDQVLDRDDLNRVGLDHSRSGELVAVAANDSWFAYPYWLDDRNAPDFARCVAIHDKPGHDPVEMFFGSGGKAHAGKRLLQSKLGLRRPFDVISLDATLIRGSHGRQPDNPAQGPMLLTEWAHGLADTISMTEVKSLLLNQLAES